MRTWCSMNCNVFSIFTVIKVIWCYRVLLMLLNKTFIWMIQILLWAHLSWETGYPCAIFNLFDQSVYCWFEPDEMREKKLSNPSLGLFPRDALSQVMNQNGFFAEIPTLQFSPLICCGNQTYQIIKQLNKLEFDQLPDRLISPIIKSPFTLMLYI